MRSAIWVMILATLAIAGCSSSQPGPSVKVGPLIDCTSSAAMQRHCDAWLPAAEQQLHSFTNSTAAPVTWTFHVGQSMVPMSGSIPSVVVFRLADGTSVNVVLHCGVYQPGDPACDLTDVTLPAH